MTETDGIFDVVIVGGGPAGLSAAIWCGDLGLRAILLESETELGGQMLSIFNPVINYPGVITANGREMRDRFAAQAGKSNAVLKLRSPVEQIDCASKTVGLANGESISGKNLIIATGVRRRRLGVPGESELAGRGIIESGSKDRESVAGKRVAIIGGGDAALENASILGEHAQRVYVVHRRAEFSARREFVETAASARNIEFVMNSAVTAIGGNNAVEAVNLEHLDSRKNFIIPVDYVLIRIGVRPNSELVRDKLDLDPRGYIKVDATCETTVPGVYAIGDIASPISPTISTAAGHGATTAKAIAAKIYT